MRRAFMTGTETNYDDFELVEKGNWILILIFRWNWKKKVFCSQQMTFDWFEWNFVLIIPRICPGGIELLRGQSKRSKQSWLSKQYFSPHHHALNLTKNFLLKKTGREMEWDISKIKIILLRLTNLFDPGRRS